MWSAIHEASDTAEVSTSEAYGVSPRFLSLLLLPMTRSMRARKSVLLDLARLDLPHFKPSLDIPAAAAAIVDLFLVMKTIMLVDRLARAGFTVRAKIILACLPTVIIGA